MSDEPMTALPIKIDSTSNGEFVPVPVGRTVRRAQELAAARISENARRVGQSRRAFMTGLCGAATTLLTLDHAFAQRGNVGGRFRVHPEAAFEPAAAADALAGSEFVFDIQTHMVDPDGPWRRGPNRAAMIRNLAAGGGGQGRCGLSDPVDCYAADRFIKDIFLDSDTDMAVLSFMPGLPDDNYLTLKEAARTRELVARLGRGQRLLLHAMVIPNQTPLSAQLDGMARAVEEWRVSAFKVYTQWGPNGRGWWLDDPQVGIPFIEKARALGVRIICIHKGLSFGGYEARYAGCDDVGRVARRYPDMNFMIYHSGFEPGRREGPYDPANSVGVDSLIKSLRDNGVPPNSNVFAELGSTWRMVMRDPTAAAHTLGKLLRYVGENRVAWGTDTVWYGSPQDQIQAFRAFEIAPELQARHGYPALTPEIKRKILGLNAAPIYGVDPASVRKRAEADEIGRARAAYRGDPAPTFDTLGPRTPAEFHALLRERGGMPG